MSLDVAKVHRPDVFKDKKVDLKSDLVGFRIKVDCTAVNVDSFELIVSDNEDHETLLKLDAKDIKRLEIQMKLNLILIV